MLNLMLVYGLYGFVVGPGQSLRFKFEQLLIKH